ncbi:MAG: hypothetical protein IJQ98_07715, partial [Oscillospiraceae bacterium]|nr:hypothetical protein [Oscillospiraceae bacterium]
PSISYGTSAAAGTAVTLKAADGTVLLTWEVPCSFTYLTVSCPGLTVGETYTLAIGDTEEEVTLESSVTTLGTTTGMGGGFGRGMFGSESEDGSENGFGGHGGHGGWGKHRNTETTQSAE